MSALPRWDDMPQTIGVDPCTDERWEALAAGPGGSLFTSPPWIRAVSECYGFTPQATVQLVGGTPAAGTTWVDVRDIRGERRIALPFGDRADPIAADSAAWHCVAGEALDGDLPYTLRCLDSSPAARDRRLSHVGVAAWHTTALDRSADELYRALRPQARRNIATAREAGVEVELRSDADAVRDFHRLHVELRRGKYRLLAQPLDFFLGIWQQFAPRDGIRTALAMVDGRPVAGAMYLVWQDTVYYKFGASDVTALRRRPNDALHWTAIRWAQDRGLRSLDWGLSDLDQPGLCSYKRKWASVEGRIVTLNAGGPPVGRDPEVDRLLGDVTRLITDPAVPHDIAARAGARLYRYFC